MNLLLVIKSEPAKTAIAIISTIHFIPANYKNKKQGHYRLEEKESIFKTITIHTQKKP